MTKILKLCLVYLIIIFCFIAMLHSEGNYKFHEDDQPPQPIPYYMNNQWNDGILWYSYIKEDQVVLYEETNLNSEKLKTFNQYDVITVILRKMINSQIWSFVAVYDDTGDYLVYGWVKEYQILLKKDFKPIDKFKFKKIIVGERKLENYYEFNFEPNGKLNYTFSQYKVDKNTGKAESEPYFTIRIEGEVVQYKNLFWFKTNATEKKQQYFESDFIVKFVNNKMFWLDDRNNSNPIEMKYELFVK